MTKEQEERLAAYRDTLIAYREFATKNARVLWEFECWSLAVSTTGTISQQEMDEVWAESGKDIEDASWGTITELAGLAGFDLDKEPEAVS